MSRLLKAILWVMDEEVYGTQLTWEKAMIEYRLALLAERSNATLY